MEIWSSLEKRSTFIKLRDFDTSRELLILKHLRSSIAEPFAD
jgi:hypothetical protein